MNRRCNQNTFSIFSRKCKNRLTHMTSRTLIKQAVISSSRGNMDLLRTYHIMKLVCIDSGCIYHIPCPENPIICMDFPSLIYWFNIRNFRIKFELHTIYICILSHCNVQIKRTYNSGCRCIKCGIRLIGNIRFHFFQFLTVKNSQLLNTICNASVIQCLKIRHILFMQTYNQRAIFLKWEIQIL